MTDAAPPPGDGPDDGERLAAFWKRAVALLLDGLIAGGAVALAWLAIAGELPRAGDDDLGTARGLAFAQLAAGLVYFGALNGSRRGQTIGKATLGIQVRDAASGGPIGYWRAAARFLMVWVLGILRVPAVIDGLWALFDPRRQTWHDKAVRSVVVDAPKTATS